MKDRSYLMAFVDQDGEVYNVHLVDDLKSHETWEYIDFKFSLPHSCYILIWRRDEKKIDKDESKFVTKYIREDMKDFINDGSYNDKNDQKWHYKIVKKVTNSNSCLILQWDEITLPEQFSRWKEFATVSYNIALKESEEISKPGSIHDLELDIYAGRIHQQLRSGTGIIETNHKFRESKYSEFKIPSDEILQKYVTEMLLENYVDANLLLSNHYEIFPAKVDIENDPPDESYVYYDFVHHTIMFSPSRIPDLSLQVPAFLLGFFRHLAEVKSWKFDNEPKESIKKERQEAEKFMAQIIQHMLEIGIDPRSS